MKITIERGKKKYIMHTKGVCARKCSFVRRAMGDYCTSRCRLPQWFMDMVEDIMRGRYIPYLEEVKTNDLEERK
jgi:hypothetical protein